MDTEAPGAPTMTKGIEGDSCTVLTSMKTSSAVHAISFALLSILMLLGQAISQTQEHVFRDEQGGTPIEVRFCKLLGSVVVHYALPGLSPPLTVGRIFSSFASKKTGPRIAVEVWVHPLR